MRDFLMVMPWVVGGVVGGVLLALFANGVFG